MKIDLNDIFYLAGAGAEDLVFEALPDFEQPDFHLKLCRIRVFDIGDGLPCVELANTKSKESYTKSDEAKLNNDYGSIEIGNVCPVNYPNGDAMANKFKAQAVFTIQPNEFPTSEPGKITN